MQHSQSGMAAAPRLYGRPCQVTGGDYMDQMVATRGQTIIAPISKFGSNNESHGKNGHSRFNG